MHGIEKTVNELHDMLKLHEETLPKKEVAHALHAIRAGRIQINNKNKKPLKAAKGKNQGKGKTKLAYALNPKIPTPPKKNNPAKDAICHECNEIGHWRRNFPKDLGLEGSKKLKPGALNLYVGNDHRVAVEAIETSYLCLPSGLVIVLNDCDFAPSITRGIISVSRLYDNGFINCFENNGQVKLRLYSLVALSSWTHYQEAHSEVANDGLLKSTDDESFDKYVSCLSRKMARKPFSHQVERAKDLLGLIHTDVCDPFITVSRQGASYFVTFTNDFSHYSYVYLLKHKHEVFETFKVSQKDVQNQLGKTIKALIFVRGGEFMSQEFLDHLKEHVIVSQRTSPYTPQHNGVSERRNRTLLDMVRSNMSQTTLPKSTRISHAPDWMFLYVDVEEHELGDHNEPKNYKDALLYPEYKNGLMRKWLFKKKTDMDRKVHTYKARLIVKGFTQTYEVYYDETFTLVADVRAIRILIVIVAFYDYEIWQMDVKIALLNGHLSKEVYMVQPEGFVNLKYLNQVCKLKHSIYGLKQASWQWNKRFDEEIKKFGFTQNGDEPCVCVKASGGNVTFLILYVDDILIMGNHIPILQDAKSYLGKCFAMKHLGEATYILGIKI
ncbi:retrotransposon protein, putative, ty1-copia subclass [Tanacetum coccineum]